MRGIIAAATLMLLAGSGGWAHGAAGGSPVDLNWLLEEAYEKEYVPLRMTDVTMPEELEEAMDYYDKGEFRRSIHVLERVRALNLPDGRNDFIVFALAENYRRLGCADLASENYNDILRLYPGSDKAPPSLYRLIETALDGDRRETLDSLSRLFEERFASHPLMNSVHYLNAYANYRSRNFERAVSRLDRISSSSSRFVQAQFLAALCYLQVMEYQKALVVLEPLRKQGNNKAIAAEAGILIGDVYYLQGSLDAAYRYYREVPRSARRHHYAIVKMARVMLDQKKTIQAARISRSFMRRHRSSPYYFEMASIFEQAKSGGGAVVDSGIVQRQILGARVEFEIFDEIDRVTTLLRSWQHLLHQAIREQRPALQKDAHSNIARLQLLEKKCYALLKKMLPEDNQGRAVIPYQAERRYMGMLKTRMVQYNDTIGDLRFRLDSVMTALRSREDDSLLLVRADNLATRVDSLKRRRESTAHEYDLVVRECISNNPDRRDADEELQSEYIDWGFARYLEKKERLKEVMVRLSAQARRKNEASRVDAEELKTAVRQIAEQWVSVNDRKVLEREIVTDRERLVGHMRTILEVYPQSKYNPQIMFRLAELYYDAAGDRFQERLKQYEARLASETDSMDAEFPEYQLDTVISTYDRIIEDYPYAEITDAACFYKGLALQKIGRDEEANAVMQKLIASFPESQYFVAANMSIGKYYFDHPRVENGTGYKLAEEAYRRVLVYREHPEYVQALYHLGWCYYMQDQYDEAIAVFKYLIEDTKLEFDPSKADETKVANPLLRDEAIDYIAISFDAGNRIEDAIQFLKLIGNVHYASMVLKRIGELREEDLDFKAATRIYRRLIEEYPVSREAPAAYVSLIRLYDSHDRPDSAMRIRERFFENTAGLGGEWRTEVAGDDSLLLRHIDSMAIANGLFVADAAYRRADSLRDTSSFARAASYYQRLVDNYPGNEAASEALWNLAVILDTKLFNRPEAYERYVAFSRLDSMERERREQAALNAVAIAQSLLPPDSLSRKDVLDFSAAKVVEAVDNYVELFPDGKSVNRLTLTLGGIYFNRRLFSEAADEYRKVIDQGRGVDGYFEALSFLGQCRYGQEDWPAAIATFAKIHRESGDSAGRESAYRLLLQSEFLNAKKHLAAGEFSRAAELFRAIDDSYPGSVYGDIVLFNAAGAYEKIQEWESACASYAELVKRYPRSKLAPDALFNRAEDYEKLDKYAKAAESYEQLAAEYPESAKAKDALFNVGFCYEKLNQLDKMAEANERYSTRYPGEKDVEAILFRSASYYAKAKMWDRAIAVYRNFIRRYPRGVKSIEAYFMIAKCYYDQNDLTNALLSFSQTEQQNMAFARDNLPTNNYFAAEAAYYTGQIKRDRFREITLSLPEKRMKKLLKEKSALLGEAAKAFQRVIQYQSERMFEAAYSVGQLYEEMAFAWRDQQRPSLDALKKAVLEKDIATFSSSLLQKSFIPYQKAVELARGFDSLSAQHSAWVGRSDSSLTRNYLGAGRLLSAAAAAMRSAPVPKEIRDKPLYFFQYQKQLNEALLPLQEQVVAYYDRVLMLCDSLELKGDAVDSCRTAFAYSHYATGRGFDSLATQILKSSKDISNDKRIPQEEREDLIFQLEDIVFEVQDKAIFAYEDALAAIELRDLRSSFWGRKTLQSLARLSPERFGVDFYERVVFSSDDSWIVRSDSAASWNTIEPPRDGWVRADTSLPVRPEGFALGTPRFIGDSGAASRFYTWKHLFLEGAPRNATVYIATPCVFRLFVNGALIMSDTVGNRDLQRIDSVTGITSMLKGGDNCLAAEITAPDGTPAGAAIVFTGLVDTMERFTTSLKLPDAVPVAKAKVDKPEKADSRTATGEIAAKQEKKAARDTATYVSTYRNRGELLKAIDTYREREAASAKTAKRERLEIQKIQIVRDSVDQRIKTVVTEIEQLKKKIAEKSRRK